MAVDPNFNKPENVDLYSDVLEYIRDMWEKLGTMSFSSTDNIPEGAMSWDNTTSVFKRYSSSTFSNVVLSIAGGGTGATTASGARSNLGLGNIVTYDTLNATASATGNLSSSYLTINSNIVPDTDCSYSLGSTGLRWQLAFIDSLTLTNALPIASGGTGRSTLASNEILIGNGTTGILSESKNTAFNKNFGTTADTVVEGNDSRLLTDAQLTSLTSGAETNLHKHNYSQLNNLPSIAYSSPIAADDFTQTEVDNLRSGALDDGTTPWTSNNYFDATDAVDAIESAATVTLTGNLISNKTTYGDGSYGKFEISYNTTTKSLDFDYIG